VSVGASNRQQQAAERFAALHQGPTFLIPNPWDAGSARVLEALGFVALATTSSGFAFTLGRRDGNVSLDEVVAHTASITAASALPLSVDLEDGHASDADGVAAAIDAVAGAGAVGASIEDYDREHDVIRDIDASVARVAAAVAAARAFPLPFTLTARAENHIHGISDLDDTIARLRAYEAAGADVLFAPGLRSADEIRAVCTAVTKPVNVLGFPGITVAEIAACGARRISVGGSLTWVAVRAMSEAATALRETGDLSALDARLPLDDWFGR
jgi:2-methylisocitrate lyase-like PEP mutase family enzyme